MTRAAPWFTLVPVATLAAVAPTPAAATTYMSVAEAQRHFFPTATAFADRSLRFTPDQRKAISRASGSSAPDGQAITEVRGPGGRLGWVMIDRVLGKHELITYALALGPDGMVRGVEILDYRETYGGEIRNPRWRAQFTGRRPGQSLSLGRDIKNISGATLSSRHVTDGIRRLLVTYDLLLKGR